MRFTCTEFEPLSPGALRLASDEEAMRRANKAIEELKKRPRK
jgi:hypothetical protein